MTTQLNLLQRDWCERFPAAVQAGIWRSGDVFTTDGVRSFSLIEDPPHPNWWGVALARMKAKGLIERVGYQPSKRPEANGRPIAVWRVL